MRCAFIQLARREIVYRALMGETGSRLRAFSGLGSQAIASPGSSPH